MKKQYNEELVMNLVKALEIALPEGMSVLVVGSGCCENDSPNNGWVYGSREDWVLCDDEIEVEEEEEPHANMERIREMLEDIAELMADL